MRLVWNAGGGGGGVCGYESGKVLAAASGSTHMRIWTVVISSRNNPYCLQKNTHRQHAA